MKRITGLVSPTYTPLHDDGSIAPERVAPFVEYLIKNRFTALFALGSTGEFTALTTAERKTIAEAYVDAANHRLPVIINVGSCSYAESIDLARHAEAYGADAVCLIAPFYFRPSSVRALADFVKTVARETALPVFIYHVPGITGCRVPMDQFLKIMLEEVPNFAGMKFTHEDLCEFQRCVDLSEKLQILSGRDEMLLGALAMGGKAAVGTTFNYLPRLYNGLLDAFQAGNLDEARRLQGISHRAVSISGHYGLISIKTFMKFAGYDMGPMRLPVLRQTPEEEKSFRAELSAAGLDPWIG